MQKHRREARSSEERTPSRKYKNIGSERESATQPRRRRGGGAARRGGSKQGFKSI